MYFAVPIAFTLIGLALPIVALYILKVRLRRVLVSTNLFWKQIYDEKPPRSIWQHFRHLFSLLMQLLLLLLIVLAIADPYFSWQLRESRRVVLVIDNSAGMRATDVAPSRLGAAKVAALEIIDGLRFRDEVAIVLAGSTPEVLVGMSTHATTLRDTINAISFSDNPTQLTAAIELGRQLIGQHPHGSVVVMTDGCVESVVTRSVSEGSEPGKSIEQDSSLTPRVGDSASRIINSGERFPVEYRLFSTNASNVGITQLQVRRSLIDPLGYEILASVVNASATGVACRLELLLNDLPVDVIPLTLKPEELWSRSIEKTSLEGGRLQGVLTQIHRDDKADVSEKTNRTDSDTLDQLSTDNSAWALLPDRKTQRVLIVSQGNVFLQKVFESNPLVDVSIRKDFPEQWPGDSIIVLHGPVPSVLPAGNVFVIDPIGSCDQWEQGETMENPLVTEQDRTSPLMNHIRLDNILIPDAKELRFRTLAHSLAKTLSGETVYAEVRRPDGKCLVLSVNLDRGDLVFRTAFPIMVANSLGWFSGSAGELQQSLPTGAVTTVTINGAYSAANNAMLNSPNGKTRPVAVTGTNSMIVTSDAGSSLLSATIGPLHEVGVWSVSHGKKNSEPTVNGSDNILAEVAVNLASDRESDLRPLKELVESRQIHSPSAGWFSRPFWYYLVLLACILTTLEWFLYQRRLIS